MAGGKGTRFWPLSRSQRPKQLLKILSPKTLIRETVDRALALVGAEQTVIVTVGEQLSALRNELHMLSRVNFIAEPQGKNTAPCNGLAALEIATRDPGAVMIVLPADHWIPQRGPFYRTLKRAVALAAGSEKLITIGIRPDYAETGYGYIMKGKPLRHKRGAHAFSVSGFKEKPTLNQAKELIRRGSLWNSGIFAWHVGTFLELLQRYQPEIFAGLKRISQAAGNRSLATAGPKLRAIIGREYKKMPSISIDHGVFEKAGSEGRVLTLEADFAWSDIGSWAAVHRMMPKDADGNAGSAKWLGLDAKNCLIHAPDRLVVLFGIDDAFVVDTPDALLVGDLKRSQEVRDLVEKLHSKGYGAYTIY
jgi:mannose-1-phosphate guanylyltransferase